MATDLVEGACDLPERAAADSVHEHVKQVLVVDGRLPQPGEHLRGRILIAVLEFTQTAELALLLVIGRPLQDDRLPSRRVGVEEGVDPDDRIAAVVLHVLVVQRFVLNLAALVAGLHGAQHAAAFGDAVELRQHRRLHEIRQFVDQE